MSAEVRPLVPGERLAGRPWLRRLGNQVVRYVRASIEDPGIKFLRQIDSEEMLETALQRQVVRLISDLDTLRAFGVGVVPVEAKVCTIPYYLKKEAPPLAKRGLRITSSFVTGGQLGNDGVCTTKNEPSLLAARLRDYLDMSISARQPFLSDIFWPEQYIVGNTGQPMLVDVDPIYAAPSEFNQREAHKGIELIGQL